jgi:streptogramin lyase
MTLYVIAPDAEMAARHADAKPDLWFTREADAVAYLARFTDPTIRRDFHVFAVEDGPGPYGKVATLIDKAGEIAACLLLIIGGMWATGALSLWERLA